MFANVSDADIVYRCVSHYPAPDCAVNDDFHSLQYQTRRNGVARLRDLAKYIHPLLCRYVVRYVVAVLVDDMAHQCAFDFLICHQLNDVRQ